MKKILVTGGTGFIGSHCLEELSQSNYEIHAISRNSNKKIKNVVWHNIDLFDENDFINVLKLVKPNYLMHLAWKMETGLNLNSNNNEKWFNLSKNIIDLFYKHGGERVLATGSGFEYDLTYKTLSESESPINPNNEYGKSKSKLFNYLESSAEKNNTSFIWARIFFAYGPGQKKQSLLPYVVDCMMKNIKVETTDGNQQYDYIFVKDVARALVLLLESSYNGPVNVSSGKVTKLKDMVLKIGDHFNKKELLDFGARERPVGTPDFILGENDRLKTITSWKEEYNVDNGIEELIEYFKPRL